MAPESRLLERVTEAVVRPHLDTAFLTTRDELKDDACVGLVILAGALVAVHLPAGAQTPKRVRPRKGEGFWGAR